MQGRRSIRIPIYIGRVAHSASLRMTAHCRMTLEAGCLLPKVLSFKVETLGGLIFALTRMSHGPLAEIQNHAVKLADAPMQAVLEREGEVYSVTVRPTGVSEPMALLNRIADRMIDANEGIVGGESQQPDVIRERIVN